MPFASYETFRGVTHIGRDNFSENLLHSMIDWLRWCALNVGAFQNVDYTSSGLYGGDFSRLRLVDDPNYTDGQVWEGFRSDWVWETGIAYTETPNFCSGIYVDNIFYPTATETGTYAHTIDFPHGRVVFDSAISTSATVNASYAHRTINFTRANEEWFHELLYNSYRIDRPDFLAEGSGQWDQLAHNRQQMPVVGVQLDTRHSHGYELGSSWQYAYQDVIFYVLSEYESERNQIVDILAQQGNRSIWTYNLGLLKESANYPVDLDVYGYPVDNPYCFPQLVAPTGDGGFQYRKVYLHDMRIQSLQTIDTSLFLGTIRCTIEAIV